MREKMYLVKKQISSWNGNSVFVLIQGIDRLRETGSMFFWQR